MIVLWFFLWTLYYLRVIYDHKKDQRRGYMDVLRVTINGTRSKTIVSVGIETGVLFEVKRI